MSERFKAAAEKGPLVIRCDSESTPLAFSLIFSHRVGWYTGVIEDLTRMIMFHKQEEMLLL